MTFINFQIQWHITEKCPNQCKHCYMFDEEYKRRIENEKNYMELRVANSHFLRPAGPHFPASQGHIKRSALEIGRARGAPPC